MPINCFTQHGRDDLQKKHDKLVEGGMPEKEAARKVILDEHENLHNSLNDLRKQINPKSKLEPYQKQDNGELINSINSKYDAISKREPAPLPMDETPGNSSKVGEGIPQPEQTTNAQGGQETKGQGEEKVGFDKFREDALDMYDKPLSKWDWRVESTMPTADRIKGVADIRAGKKSAAATKIEAEIKKMHDEGNIPMNRGSGSQVEHRDFSFEELGIKNKAAEELEPHIEKWLKDEAELTPEQEHHISDNIDNIIQEHETETKGQNQQPSTGQKETGSEINSEITSKPKNNGEEGKMTGITHEQMDETSKELGLGEYEESPEKVKEWDEQAEKRLEKPNAMHDLLNRMRDGQMPDKVEQRMMIKYVSDLKARLEADPTNDALLTELKRTKDLSNIVGGREVAKSLRARQGEVPVEKTLPDFLIRDMEANGGAKLTDAQKQTSIKEHKEISEAEAKLEEKTDNLKTTQFGKKSTTKKTHDEYVADRKSIIDKMREDLLKVAKGGGGLTSSIPGAAQLQAIAPHVLKLAESFVSEGVDKLSDLVKEIHGALKDTVEGISEKDVHNVLAGELPSEKKTVNETRAKLRDLKQEAELINKYEKLQNGEEPKSEKSKQKRNQEIEQLRGQIKEHDLTKLSNYKSKVTSEIAKVQKDLDTGNFLNEQPKKPELKLDKESIALKDNLIKLKQEREVRLIQQQYAHRSKTEKLFDATKEVLNVPRTIMSSMDFSAPLRQGVIPTIAHPIIAGKALVTGFKQMLSQKVFDRWFHDLRQSPEYKVMEQSGLYVSDPHDYRLTAKEEHFMNNLAEKIPFGIGAAIKGSERGYVGYLNKLRTDLFSQGARVLESQGKTIENAKSEYEALAKWTNISTGRGEVHKSIETAAPILNAAFFAPRLIAARLQALNPMTYIKLPPTIRKQALGDMLKFVGFGTSVLALSKLNGAQVETDPRSTDFGKIKTGDTRYDIWGGFQPYVRFLSQMATGQRKQTGTNKVVDLNGKGPFGQSRADVVKTFIRGKLSPIPSMAWDFADNGRNLFGQKQSLAVEAEKNFLPMISGDISDAWKQQGVKSLFTVGIPSAFGVGVNTYSDKKAGKARK